MDDQAASALGWMNGHSEHTPFYGVNVHVQQNIRFLGSIEPVADVFFLIGVERLLKLG